MHSIRLALLRPVALAVVTVLALGAFASVGVAETPKPAAAPAPAKVLATIDGAPVTRQEVDAMLIEQLLARQPNLLATALAQVIDFRLLDMEAAKQGVTREQLISREIGPKITAVTDAEVDAFYEQKKAQIQAPKDQAAAQIKAYLETQHRQAAYRQYVDQLRGRHDVKDMLAEQQAADEAVQALARRTLIEKPGTPTLGAADAKVVLVEFSDFQCPFCGRATPAIQEVQKKYAGQVKLVFHQLPLISIHPFAQKAAEASLCADEQGKFWEMHDLLFQEQDKLGVADLKDKASRAGVDVSAFNGCLDGGKMAAKVAAELDLASQLNVHTTPTLFLNGREVGYDALSKEVDGELAKTKK